MKTNLFRQCIGVFEGGGVRGAAFGGAFLASEEAKINFIGTLGTSAGSIVAVLIAANISASEILEIMKIPFNDLLKRPIPPTKGNFKQKTLSMFGGSVETLAKLQYSMGLYSSIGIQTWLENILSQKLKIINRPVKFSDLSKPCGIIATDLKSSSYKIWSTKNTPDSSVSFAVRCSCTIPFFFQPVDGEGTTYVDGGIISNLPLFLVPELGLEKNIPVLCFRLIQNHKAGIAKPISGLDLIKAIIPAVLNGVTEIQLNAFEKRQIIDIATGDISSTDFDIDNDKINLLIENGKNSVKDFVKNEQTRVLKSQNRDIELKGYREGLLEETAYLINNSTKTIEILAGDLSWLKALNVTLLKAVLRGIKIRIVSEKNDSHSYLNAIKGAKALGAEIVEIDKDKNYIKGTAIDLDTTAVQIITIEESPTIHGKRYSLPYDTGFIEMFRTNFNLKFVKNKVTSSGVIPSLHNIRQEQIIDCLKRGVPYYSNCKISMEILNPNNLLPLSKYLEQLKLNRAEEVEEILKNENIMNAAYLKGSPWLITPPVIELLKNGQQVIIDGTHRVYNAIQKDRKEINVVLIDNNTTPLPSKIQNWNSIVVKSIKLPPEKRYDNYNENYYRRIREAFTTLIQD